MQAGEIFHRILFWVFRDLTFRHESSKDEWRISAWPGLNLRHGRFISNHSETSNKSGRTRSTNSRNFEVIASHLSAREKR